MTLLELLKAVADHHQQRATAPDEPGFSKWIHADLANGALDALARMHAEAVRADEKARLPWSEGRTMALLERINGGPLKHPRTGL